MNPPTSPQKKKKIKNQSKKISPIKPHQKGLKAQNTTPKKFINQTKKWKKNEKKKRARIKKISKTAPKRKKTHKKD